MSRMMTRAMLKAKTKRENENTVEQGRSMIPEDCIAAELIPNLPNDITLQVICPLLPWRTFRTLSSVSPAWGRATESGATYAARARSHSTETLAVINQTICDGVFGIGLYSLGDEPELRENLPPIPRVMSEIPQSCECIALDGKLYVLGGLKNPCTQLGSKDVYVLNLAGHRQWRKCASMHSPRHKFGSGIIDGKIYVCGGSSRRAPVYGTEVYDPKADAWTAVMPIPFARTGHDVSVVEGELFVYGGSFFDQNFRQSKANFRRSLPTNLRSTAWSDHIPEVCYTYTANHVEVYNPVKDEWRRLRLEVTDESADPSKPDKRHSDDRLFMAKGKLFSISSRNIAVFDFETVSWTGLHSIMRATGLGLYHPHIAPSEIRAIQVVGDSIFAVGGPWFRNSNRNSRNHVCFLRLSKPGIGTRFRWDMANYFVSFEGLVSPFIRAVQL